MRYPIPRPPIRIAGRAIAAILSILCLIWGAQAMAIEEPSYQVVREYPQFELRRYAPDLLAQMQVSGDFDAVGNTAFRVLAGYIFGANRTGESIAMTAPVNQWPASPPAADAAAPAPPRSPESGDYLVSFGMPKQFTLETLPAPKDPRIRIRTEPGRLMAARRYSGRWTLANYRENETALLDAVRAAGLTPLAAPVYARYNPPFTPWFMRRNEVLVEVADPHTPDRSSPK
jgi:hypothetical protein